MGIGGFSLLNHKCLICNNVPPEPSVIEDMSDDEDIEEGDKTKKLNQMIRCTWYHVLVEEINAVHLTNQSQLV